MWNEKNEFMKPRKYFSNTSVFGYFIHLKIIDNLIKIIFMCVCLLTFTKLDIKTKKVFKPDNIQAHHPFKQDFPCSSLDKESVCNAGDLGSIPGLGRSPGGGHGTPLQCSCLENLMDRGAWQATVHGVDSWRRHSY